MSLEKGPSNTESPKQGPEKSTQRMYDGIEGVDWEWNEDGFPRRIAKETDPASLEKNPDKTPSVTKDETKIFKVSNNETSDTSNPTNLDENVRIDETIREKRISEEQMEYTVLLNHTLQEMAAEALPLLNALVRRDREGLTQLCDPATFRGITAHFTTLSRSDLKFTKEDIQATTHIIRSITKLLQNFGVPRGSTIRDSAESLTALVFTTRTLQDSVHASNLKLIPQNQGTEILKSDIEHLCNAVRQLDYSTGELWGNFLKLRSIVSGQR